MFARINAAVSISLFCVLCALPFAITHASTGEAAEPLQVMDASGDNWSVKRQVLSRPDVLLDMANMTESGYQWTNDVVWRGDDVQ